MSVADRISNLFSSNSSTSSSSSTFARPSLDISSGNGPTIKNTPAAKVAALEAEDESESRPPYLHSIVAGGIGGSTGDMLMHSLDTVKTRQQGAPNAIKYATMSDAYSTIFREEGFRRGLYGGVAPAFMGSLPGTMIFFGVYEYSKRHLIDAGCPASLAYLTGGFLGDLCASVIYVPSEVLKTRLQLQGRYNNPHFKSGYNYRGTFDAARTIFRREGPAALFYGYKATLMRDLPFSALQFAFYEQFQKLAKSYSQSRDIGLHLEILTGAMAGGLAGVITCPLDVVKTRIQTQVRTSPPSSSTSTTLIPKKAAPRRSSSPTAHKRSLTTITPTHKPPPHPLTPSCHLRREISTSSPSTPAPPIPGAMKFNTSSIFLGLKLLYQNEGLVGWFRGVGPRAVWTSVQSGTMLVLYQSLLKQMEKWENHEGDSL